MKFLNKILQQVKSLWQSARDWVVDPRKSPAVCEQQIVILPEHRIAEHYDNKDWAKISIAISLPFELKQASLLQAAALLNSQKSSSRYGPVVLSNAEYKCMCSGYSQRLNSLVTAIQRGALSALPWTPVLASTPLVSMRPEDDKARITFQLAIPDYLRKGATYVLPQGMPSPLFSSIIESKG